MKYSYFDSPIGPLLIAVDDGNLHMIGFEHDTRSLEVQADWQEDAVATATVIQQLEEYFAGTRQRFELSLVAQATPFQALVLQELKGVEFGTTISYAELAQRSGNPKAVRAVGTACGRNPIPIVIPCHRIIGSNGKLTGFAGGLAAKQYLLEHERSHRITSP